MKTELIIPESKPELKFPLLAQSKNNQVVVLFSSVHTGTVVRGGRGFEVGCFSQSWAPFNDSTTWTILPPGTQLILTVE